MMHFFALYGHRLATATWIHCGYVAAAVGIGFIVGCALAVGLSRVRSTAKYVLPVLSLFQTIPGIVFIGILFLYNGMRPSTVISALSVYAVFPILKHTFIGITGVEARYLEAAKGCGMSAVQRLIMVEIPMALPSILAGLRISTIYTVSWAVLAAVIGMGGLGELIYAGVSSNNNALILGGAIPAAILALLWSLAIDGLRWILIPKPLRDQDR